MKRIVFRILFIALAVALVAALAVSVLRGCDIDAREFPYKTVKQSVNKGMSWGNSKIIEKIKFCFEIFHPWIGGLGLYAGARDPAEICSVIMSETAGTFNPSSYTKDSKLGEAGLLSVHRDEAKKYGYDACDPRANILMASLASFESRVGIIDKYKDVKWFQNASYKDRWIFTHMFGGAGGGAVKYLLKLSMQDAKSKKAKKQLPIYRILNFLTLHGAGLEGPEHEGRWGRQTVIIAAYRIARVVGDANLLIKIYGSEERWASCLQPNTILAKDYSYLPPYPGDDNHGHCCERWQVAPGKSKSYACWRKNWDMPSYFHMKQVGEGLKYLFKKYCDGKEKCSMDEMMVEWKKQKQVQGLLPTDEEYAESEARLRASGCWILL